MMKSTKLLFAPALVALMALTGCKGGATEIKVTKDAEKDLYISEKIDFKANSNYVVNADFKDLDEDTLQKEFDIYIFPNSTPQFADSITDKVINDDTIKLTTTKALKKVTFSGKKLNNDEFAYADKFKCYHSGDKIFSKESTKLKIEFTAKENISGYVYIPFGT